MIQEISTIRPSDDLNHHAIRAMSGNSEGGIRIDEPTRSPSPCLAPEQRDDETKLSPAM